ncbi:MAG TPA: class I SAM-dependent methyltransferase [bacterium]|nr:class I SAM-dependent methyltransferase [bacterium]HQL61918.1 class I SAM-dependent methyltransferase [bacterium]
MTPNPDDTLKTEAMQHLRAQYAGILTESQIEKHYRTYVEAFEAEKMFRHLDSVLDGRMPGTLLDIGCGFGSFVLLCRNKGIEAVGVELAEFDVGFARRRYELSGTPGAPESVYVRADALNLPFPSGSFEVVTLWNLVEHVPDYRRLIRETWRVLNPGGLLILIAPNYAAFRREAHYHLPWFPLLPKPVARLYLRLCGRNPRFLDTSIFYCTNRGVLNACRETGYRILVPGVDKILHPESCRSNKTRRIAEWTKRLHIQSIVNLLLSARHSCPFKPTILIRAKKD